MACPQCGSEVPPDDSFCGKCGYAMREGTPERVDQSRIRVHEEPDPMGPSTTASSQRRPRQGTMVGMPAATPGKAPSPPSAPESPPPTEISAARERAKKRTPQKTMLGIPRPDIVPPPTPPAPTDNPDPSQDPDATATEPSEADESGRPQRARARVRYDSINEPFPALQRRKKALRGLLVLVALAGVWLAYRFVTLNG